MEESIMVKALDALIEGYEKDIQELSSQDSTNDIRDNSSAFLTGCLVTMRSAKRTLVYLRQLAVETQSR